MEIIIKMEVEDALKLLTGKMPSIEPVEKIINDIIKEYRETLEEIKADKYTFQMITFEKFELERNQSLEDYIDGF